eukprot:3973971-Prymnesium_polylepis.1
MGCKLGTTACWRSSNTYVAPSIVGETWNCGFRFQVSNFGQPPESSAVQAPSTDVDMLRCRCERSVHSRAGRRGEFAL